jgi:two-component system chemotaxis response regulator CheY
MAFNVLVVDDSAVMRAMISRVVRLSGVPLGEMFEAGNGAEGLRAVAEHWVDLVLLDINMPVMNGEDMLRQLRAAPDTSSLPVIVVSTESSETRVAALEELGVAFVHKPFAPEDLRDTILRITGVTPDDEYYAVPASGGGNDDF